MELEGVVVTSLRQVARGQLNCGSMNRSNSCVIEILLQTHSPMIGFKMAIRNNANNPTNMLLLSCDIPSING